LNGSVKRRDLIRYLDQRRFYHLGEGANHAICTNGTRIVPVKRHKQFDIRNNAIPEIFTNSFFFPPRCRHAILRLDLLIPIQQGTPKGFHRPNPIHSAHFLILGTSFFDSSAIPDGRVRRCEKLPCPG
jgi:hypothetical protein